MSDSNRRGVLSVIPFVTFSGLLARLKSLVPNPGAGRPRTGALNANEAESRANHASPVAPRGVWKKKEAGRWGRGGASCRARGGKGRSQRGGSAEGDRGRSATAGRSGPSALAHIPSPAFSLNLQGDANRSYSDDDRSSSNFDESEKHDSVKLSGEPRPRIFSLRPVALAIVQRKPKRVMQHVFVQSRGSAR